MNRTRRHQSGHVFRHRRRWYLRFREDVLEQDGSLVRVQRCRPLGDAKGRYALDRSEAKELAEEFLGPLNDGSLTPTSSMTLNRFLEKVYLPYIQEQRKASTYHGYRAVWTRYIRPRGELALREVRTREAEQLLVDIHRQHDLSVTTLRNIRNLLSGAFRYARRLGIINVANPVHEVVLPKARRPRQTHAYTLEQVIRMIAILPPPAAEAVGVAAFGGLRKGEVRALDFAGYDGREIRVEKSIWRSHIDETKTPASTSAVPVIAPLAKLLDRRREMLGNPRSGLIFPNSVGKPMCLDRLARDVIRPLLEKAGIPWYGWHAFRRGLATNLDRLGVRPKLIQQILRHADINTTMNIYVKSDPVGAAAAMKELEKVCATVVPPQAAEAGQPM